MKAWWLQLNAREQRLISALSAVVIVFILYSLIWQPLNTHIEKGEQKLDKRNELLAWVTSETARYQAAKGQLARPSSGSISSIVNRSARSYDISIARIQPQNNDVQVWIDSVSFTQLLQWLAQLAEKEGIQVLNIDIAASERSGEVQVKRLQLGRSE
ncbi:type II secretion system protein M [Thalassotalea sp. G2M2-11]|uniref:type II secretion system protein GspM n=1 Tax=Thalassotalea sp. G2M2-11 TaxID=2787627 RepID=UPI0019D0F9FB|nr:type II secretion system protein M [Thalassotalea sp. G2M2-11]